MAKKKDSKATAGKNYVEVRLGFYERVAGHFASIARSVVVAVVSLGIVAAIVFGWGSSSPVAIDLDLPFSGSSPAKDEVPEARSAKQSPSLLGDIHLYFRPRQVKICSPGDRHYE